MSGSPERARRFQVPHTLVLLFGMIVVAWLTTLALPQGRFERSADAHGHEVVVPGTWSRLPEAERQRLGPEVVLTAIPRGFSEAKDIIFFVFIIGGAFAIFRATGAADALIGALLRNVGHRPRLLIFSGMTVFALGSSAIGMAEEYLPFLPMLIALCVGLGFDRVTAVGVLCIGYGVGYGTAMINPFTVVIAQNIAGVEETSGLWYRALLLGPFLLLGFHHVWRYASRVKADPSRSLVADVAWTGRDRPEDTPLSGPRLIVLGAVVAAIALVVWGIKVHEWYLEEMGAIFLGLALVLGALGRLGFDGTAKAFCEGAAELTTTALLIGFANTIKIVLEEGAVIDTIIEGIARPLEGLPTSIAAVGMFLVQSLCNLFVPSGSGQAYVTMPIMSPLADIVGATRQTAVLAYQFGDGFTNILVPTNAVLIGILGLAGVPYDRWLRFVLPFMLKVLVLGSLAMVGAVLLEYS